MAYTGNTLSRVWQTVEGNQGSFDYVSTDTLATVLGSSYISDGGARGLKPGDTVKALLSNVPYELYVSSTSAAGGVTLSGQNITIGGSTITPAAIDLNVVAGWGTVTVGSTATTISASGTTTIGSSANGIYPVAAPVAGFEKVIAFTVAASSAARRINAAAGTTFDGTNTFITSTGSLDCLTLVGLSTASWFVSGRVGTLTGATV